MNRIATVQYSFNRLTGLAQLFLKSPVLDALYKEYHCEVREYTPEGYSIYQRISGYMVRNITVDNFHVFYKGDKKYQIFTQKIANNHILINDSEHGETVNISLIRSVGLDKGKTFRITPISESAAKHVMSIFADGVFEYYKALKEAVKKQKEYDILVDKK